MALSSGQDADGSRLESTLFQSIDEHVANLLPYMMARGKQESQRDELIARQRDLKEKERDKNIFPSLYEDAVYRCKEAEERAKDLESRVQVTADASEIATRRLAGSLVSSVGGQPAFRNPRTQAEAVVTRKEFDALRNSIATQSDLLELSRRLDGQVANVAAQQKAQDIILEQIDQLRQAHIAIETKIESVKTETEDVSKERREQSTAMLQRLEGLKTTAETSKQSFDDQLKSLQQEFKESTQDQHERTTFGESVADTLRSDVEDLRQKVTPLQAQLSDSEKVCFELQSKLNVLEGKDTDTSNLVQAQEQSWVQRFDALSAELKAIKQSGVAPTQELRQELRNDFDLRQTKYDRDLATLEKRLDAQLNASGTQANPLARPQSLEASEHQASIRPTSLPPNLQPDLESCKSTVTSLSRKVNAVELHLSGLRSGQEDLKTSLSQVNDHLQRSLPMLFHNIERLNQASNAITQKQAQMTGEFQGLRQNHGMLFHNHNALAGNIQKDLAETKTQIKQANEKAKEYHSLTIDTLLLERSGRETNEEAFKERLDSMNNASRKEKLVTANRNTQLIRDLTELKRDIAAIRQEQASSRKGPGPPTPAISSPNLEDDHADSASDSEPLMSRGEARRLKRKRSLETEAGVSDGSHTTTSVKRNREKHVARMNVSKGGTSFQ